MRYDAAPDVEITGTVLAVGAPNATRDGRKVMCCIVLSDTLGLVRLYPIRWQDGVKQWAIIKANVTKSSKDSRLESFRVRGDVATCGNVSSRDDKAAMLDDCVWAGDGDPVQSMNSERLSIVVVKPVGCVGSKLMPRTESLNDDDDDDPWFMPQRAYPMKPYLIWNGATGVHHETHVCAQEFYYAMQKNAEHPYRIFENAHIGDPDWQHWLVLGNINSRRNVWVIPAIHRQKKTAETTVINFDQDHGKFAGWPYCNEAAVRALFVDRQQRLFTIEDT